MKPHFSSQTSNDSIKAKLACLAILARDMSNRLTFWPNQACGHVGIAEFPDIEALFDQPSRSRIQRQHYRWQRTSPSGAMSHAQARVGLARCTPVSGRNCCGSEKWKLGSKPEMLVLSRTGQLNLHNRTHHRGSIFRRDWRGPSGELDTCRARS
jgi:hypothetical protein